MRIPFMFFLLTSLVLSQTFETDVKTVKKPWNHLNFQNDPNQFQFAIVTDRTGGHREGVFKDAVNKLNLLMPEFVICVGDLIEGYTTELAQVEKEWVEFNRMTNTLKMPFFYLPGNHDISNTVMRAEWEKRFGRRYYYFIYKDVLFITMDTTDGDGVDFSDDQINYVKDVLKAHSGVRWTFLFMHHPVWRYETNPFAPIEAVLKNRKHTVFAGHHHRYLKQERNQANYYTLATTGGGSRLRGNGFGEFDQISWMTMTTSGPQFANIRLDGILPHDISTEATAKLARTLSENVRFEHLVLENRNQKRNIEAVSLHLRFENTAADTLVINGRFFHHHELQIPSHKLQFRVAPGAEFQTMQILKTRGKNRRELQPLDLSWTATFTAHPEISLTGDQRFEMRASHVKVIQNPYDRYIDQTNITMSTPFADVRINYVLQDGKSADMKVKTYSAPLQISKMTLIQAGIQYPGGFVSGVDNRRFIPVKPLPAFNQFTKNPGLKYAYYEGEWKKLPDFSKLTAVASGISLDLELDSIKQQKDHYAVVFEGAIDIPESGMVEFFIRSDDGSRLYIDGQLVVDNDGSHSPRTRWGAIAVQAGSHRVRLEYFEDYLGEQLDFGYKRKNGEIVRFTAANLWH